MSDLEAIGTASMFKLIRKVGVLERMCPTLDLSCEENVTHDGAQAQWIRPDVLGTTVIKESMTITKGTGPTSFVR